MFSCICFQYGELLNSVFLQFVSTSYLYRLAIILSAVWLHIAFSCFCSRLKTGIMATSCWTKRDTSFTLVSCSHLSFCCKVLLTEVNKPFPFEINLVSWFVNIHRTFFMPVQQYFVYICVGCFCVNLALQGLTSFRKV